MRIEVLCYFALSAVLCITPAWSAGQPGEEGWSGRLEAGPGFLTTTDQLIASGQNRGVGDLDDSADHYTQFLPLALFNLQHAFAGSERTLYLKTPFGDDGPPGLALGGTMGLGRGGVWDISLFTRPFSKVWQDPYLTDRNRSETRELTYGLDVGSTHLFGTGLGLSYRLSRINVDEDDIGRRFDDLKRDGYRHEVGVGYEWTVGRGAVLEPQLEYSRGDREGEANASHSYAAKLAFRRFSGKSAVNVFASASVANYDKTHPIFGKTRSDTNWGVFTILSRFQLFGNPELYANLIAGFGHRNSNIDFLDANTIIGGVTLGYRF